MAKKKNPGINLGDAQPSKPASSEAKEGATRPWASTTKSILPEGYNQGEDERYDYAKPRQIQHFGAAAQRVYDSKPGSGPHKAALKQVGKLMQIPGILGDREDHPCVTCGTKVSTLDDDVLCKGCQKRENVEGTDYNDKLPTATAARMRASGGTPDKAPSRIRSSRVTVTKPSKSA